jgi:hypothetical protein
MTVWCGVVWFDSLDGILLSMEFSISAESSSPSFALIADRNNNLLCKIIMTTALVVVHLLKSSQALLIPTCFVQKQPNPCHNSTQGLHRNEERREEASHGHPMITR